MNESNKYKHHHPKSFYRLVQKKKKKYAISWFPHKYQSQFIEYNPHTYIFSVHCKAFFIYKTKIFFFTKT